MKLFLVLVTSFWLVLSSSQAAIAAPADIQRRVATKPARNLTFLGPHRLNARPQDPYTFVIPHSTTTLTVSHFNKPFPDSGKDIKPAFIRFSQWFDYQFDVHAGAQYTLPALRTGLRWEAPDTRMVIYPEEGKLTLVAIRTVVMGVQAFMHTYEYMELSFVAKNVRDDKLAAGACYYKRPLGPPEIDNGVVTE